MIILICSKCHEVTALTSRGRRSCPCGATHGSVKGDKMTISAAALPIGLANDSILRALADPPQEGEWGVPLEALILPLNRFTIEGKHGSDTGVPASADGGGHKSRGVLPRVQSSAEPE